MKTFLLNQYSTIQYYLLCVLVLFPLLPRAIHSTLIITMSIVALVYLFVVGYLRWNRKKSTELLVLSAVFFIAVISVFYSSNYQSSVKYVTRLMPLLALPMVFLVGDKLITSYKRFAMVCTLYIMAVFIRLLLTHIFLWNDLYHLSTNSWELRNKIEQFTGIHGTYLALWLGCAVLISIHLIKSYKKRFFVVSIGIIVIIYLLYWQLLIASRMAFFATMISILFMVLRLFNIRIRTIFFLGLSSFIVVGFVFQKQLLFKINELTNYESAIPNGKYEDTYPEISNEDIRSVIYYCAIKSIMKKPILGFGIGDVDQELQYCYDTEFSHTDTFQRLYYNTHSQYLLILMATGFVGFIMYMIANTVLIRWSLSISALYSGVLLLFFLCFVFENILNRHDGVLAYSIFNTLFFSFRDNN